MPRATCPECGNTRYKNYRESPCITCGGRYGGYILTSTAKECNDSDCDGGVKRSNRAKDCDACQGTLLAPTPTATVATTGPNATTSSTTIRVL
ncbi:hypothetical protein BR93DRAFT_926975 [Coniochaeta sp. PMI_546]|nr:hypothetical protein BR93DRAFT_926975 [Coniochaeta sp. PMI_546]